jgi:hypothetical protein
MLLGQADPAAPSLDVSATSTLPLLLGGATLAALGLVGAPLAHFLTSAAAVVGP